MTIDLTGVKRVTNGERERNTKKKQARERALKHQPTREDVAEALETLREEDQRQGAQMSIEGS